MRKGSAWRRILVAAVLMTVITFAIYLATAPLVGRFYMPMELVIALLPFVLGSALGGVICGRIRALAVVDESSFSAPEGGTDDDDVSRGEDTRRSIASRGIRWPEHVHAAVLSSVLVIVIVWFLVPSLSPRDVGYYPGVVGDQLRTMFAMGLSHVAGVFVLPVLDPEVRKSGPAPSRKRLFLLAALVSVIALLIDFALLRSGPDFIGLGALAFGAVIALAGVAVAVFLTLTGAVLWGAWVGGLAFLIAVTSLLTWVVTGMHWFP